MRKNRETEDLEDPKERAQSMMPDYSKSFAVGGGKKFVNITIPCIFISLSQKSNSRANRCTRSNLSVTFAVGISQRPSGNTIVESASMPYAMIAQGRWSIRKGPVTFALWDYRILIKRKRRKRCWRLWRPCVLSCCIKRNKKWMNWNNWKIQRERRVPSTRKNWKSSRP